jgi:hypothetical protein
MCYTCMCATSCTSAVHSIHFTCCLSTLHVYPCVALCCVVLCRQRRGLLPLLVLASLVLLVLLIAVARAAASAHGDERGFICFLSKLGVQIGGGCSRGRPGGAAKAAVAQALGELVEVTPRVKDIEPNVPSGLRGDAGAGAAAAAGGDAGGGAAAGGGGSAQGLRRLLGLL